MLQLFLFELILKIEFPHAEKTKNWNDK